MNRNSSEQSDQTAKSVNGTMPPGSDTGETNQSLVWREGHRFHIGATQATIAGSLSGVVPAHLIQEGEQIILAIKPSLWFIAFHSTPFILIMILFLAGLRYFFPVDALNGWSHTIHQVIAVVIFLQLLIAVLQWSSRLYVLTDRRIMRIRGIFNIDVFECPLLKVQNTFIALAWYERLLGLGTLFFATAGTAGTEAAWQNINQPLEVHELVQKAIHEAHRRWPNGQP